MNQDFLTVDYPKIISLDNLSCLTDTKNVLLFPTIYLVKKGELTISAPEKDFFMQQGAIFIVAPNTPLQVRLSTSFQLLRLSFIERNAYFETLFLEERTIACLTNQNQTISECFLTINHLYNEYLANRQLKIKLVLDAHLMLLFSQLLPVQIHQKKETYIDKDLQKAIDYFSDHYSETIKISEVASMIGLHPNYFTKKFKEYYGLSPKAFLTSVRIKKASVLMKSTDLTLKEIAKTVGYNDYLTFRKAFKGYYQNSSPNSFL